MDGKNNCFSDIQLRETYIYIYIYIYIYKMIIMKIFRDFISIPHHDLTFRVFVFNQSTLGYTWQMINASFEKYFQKRNYSKIFYRWSI